MREREREKRRHFPFLARCRFKERWLTPTTTFGIWSSLVITTTGSTPLQKASAQKESHPTHSQRIAPNRSKETTHKKEERGEEEEEEDNKLLCCVLCVVCCVQCVVCCVQCVVCCVLCVVCSVFCVIARCQGCGPEKVVPAQRLSQGYRRAQRHCICTRARRMEGE